MDYEYEGVLQILHCGICTQQIPNVHEAYDHECFKNINMENLSIVCNVVTHSESCETNFEQDNDIEYLDEYQEVCFEKLGGKEVKQKHDMGKDCCLLSRLESSGSTKRIFFFEKYIRASECNATQWFSGDKQKILAV
ncbi:uncharacterized protein LOC117177061 [Belonocnema kinseyi]|uniref:uncharacterized protein LOC117177061 n=1 Tax=Belonocnema kinseyi TaxID=2817044 RepID=UPI00143D3F2D|nr:uncharacterized protein LOC117177061 [Belonocnema kinseyi]XP_033223427.1 uncharacterized protein LOC117177061 [Belonocnema kinseyi]XP_033223428.1 uncharacterized protein LOC117177061 [Belonocnema kinseyi]